MKKGNKKRIKPNPTKSEEPVPNKQPNNKMPLNDIAGAETKPAQVSLKPMQTKLQTPASQQQPNNSEKNIQVSTGRKPKAENVDIKQMQTKLENPSPQQKQVKSDAGTKPKPKQAMV